MKLLRPALLAATIVAALWPGTAASAHTDSDLIAVPAGSEATVTLKPTHGCGESPTVEVSIRAEVVGAVGGEVAGWTVSSTPDGAGRTVVEWTGGILPIHETGAFPVTFTVPDTPGELLVFPSIQVCENGEELAWIDGDPEGEFPAPRVLVLPAGSEPAETIDEVPADAPGREQLVQIIDVDNPSDEQTVTSTSLAAGSSTTTTPASTTTSDATDSDADDDSGSDWLLPAVVIVVLAAAGGALVIRNRGRA